MRRAIYFGEAGLRATRRSHKWNYADQCLRPLVAMGDRDNPVANKQHRRNRAFGSRDRLAVYSIVGHGIED